MVDAIIYSSDSDEWPTPQKLFDTLNEEFHFTLDVAATEENAKVKPQFYTKEQNGLTSPWVGVVWCNPPYGKTISQWLQKAEDSYKEFNTTIVMLLPSRTDTKWFHSYVYNKTEIRFIKGRLKFEGATQPAPFPSMLVIWKGNHGTPNS